VSVVREALHTGDYKARLKTSSLPRREAQRPLHDRDYAEVKLHLGDEDGALSA
jgi:hypothetical protein